MNIMQERDPRFLRLERKIGMFILAAFAGILVVVVFVGVQQDVFTSRTTVSFLTDSGRDLSVGQAVKFSGFKIGKVKRVSLNEAGNVQVDMAIKSGYMKWIRDDSTARLEKERLISDSVIVVMQGSADRPQVEDEGLIVFERPPELMEIAENVMAEVKPVLLDIKKIIHEIEDPEGDFKGILRNMNRLTDDLLVTRRNLDVLLGEVGRDASAITADLDVLTASLQNEVLPDLKGLMSKAGRAAEDSEGVIRQINRELPGVLEKVNASLENMKVITDDLRRVSSKTPLLVEESGELIEETRGLVESVKGTWPFGDRDAGKSHGTLKAGSYE